VENHHGQAAATILKSLLKVWQRKIVAKGTQMIQKNQDF
jgi:hypothetical protein